MLEGYVCVCDSKIKHMHSCHLVQKAESKCANCLCEPIKKYLVRDMYLIQ